MQEPVPGAGGQPPARAEGPAVPSTTPKPVESQPTVVDNFSGPWRDSVAQAPATEIAQGEHHSEWSQPEPPHDLHLQMGEPSALDRTYDDLVGLNRLEEAVVESAKTGDPRDFIAKVKAMPSGDLTPDFQKWIANRFTGVGSSAELAMEMQRGGRDLRGEIAGISVGSERQQARFAEIDGIRDSLKALDFKETSIFEADRTNRDVVRAYLDMVTAVKDPGAIDDLMQQFRAANVKQEYGKIGKLDNRTIKDIARDILAKLGIKLPGAEDGKLDDVVAAEYSRPIIEQQARAHTITTEPAAEQGPSIVVDGIPTLTETPIPTPTPGPTSGSV